MVGLIAFLFNALSPHSCGVSNKMCLAREWVSIKQHKSQAALGEATCGGHWNMVLEPKPHDVEILALVPTVPSFWFPSSWLALQQRLLLPTPWEQCLSEIHLSVLRA